MRFLWRTDADSICTMVGPQLSDVVGMANGDLLGRDLHDLAPTIDPSGRLASALAGRSTWSGLDVSWPVADEAAGVSVGLGGIPSFREQAFDGFSGYGVIHLDQIAPRDPARLGPDVPQSKAARQCRPVPRQGALAGRSNRLRCPRHGTA